MLSLLERFGTDPHWTVGSEMMLRRDVRMTGEGTGDADEVLAILITMSEKTMPCVGSVRCQTAGTMLERVFENAR